MNINKLDSELVVKENWIIDTDAGIDDIQAIIIGLKHWNVVGITCVAGNTNVQNVATNVLKLLKICNRNDINVYIGAEKPLISELVIADLYHGKNGLGDIADHELIEINKEQLKTEVASEAIVNIVNEFYAKNEKINILGIGCLTNIALALKKDQSIAQKINKILVMGGTHSARGNITANTEYNFRTDPEAVSYVLSIIPMIHILPWETVADFFQDENQFNQMMEKVGESKIKTFFMQTSGYILKNFSLLYYCDGLAAAIAVSNDIILQQEKRIAEIELGGVFSRGGIFYHNQFTLLDQTRKEQVNLILQVNREKAYQILIDSLQFFSK